jgi:hypothetical protein
MATAYNALSDAFSGGWPFSGNYNNVLSVESDPSDQIWKWFFAIKVEVENSKPIFQPGAQLGISSFIIYPAIISSFAIQKSEKVQVINGFNEVIHLYAFGKNADQMQINGHILSNFFNPAFGRSSLLITSAYEEKLRAFSAAKSGNRVKISGPHLAADGSAVILTGVANSISYSMDATINSVINFSMSLIGVETILGIGQTPASTSETSKATIKKA